MHIFLHRTPQEMKLPPCQFILESSSEDLSKNVTRYTFFHRAVTNEFFLSFRQKLHASQRVTPKQLLLQKQSRNINVTNTCRSES